MIESSLPHYRFNADQIPLHKPTDKFNGLLRRPSHRLTHGVNWTAVGVRRLLMLDENVDHRSFGFRELRPHPPIIRVDLGRRLTVVALLLVAFLLYRPGQGA